MRYKKHFKNRSNPLSFTDAHIIPTSEYSWPFQNELLKEYGESFDAFNTNEVLYKISEFTNIVTLNTKLLQFITEGVENSVFKLAFSDITVYCEDFIDGGDISKHLFSHYSNNFFSTLNKQPTIHVVVKCDLNIYIIDNIKFNKLKLKHNKAYLDFKKIFIEC